MDFQPWSVTQSLDWYINILYKVLYRKLGNSNCEMAEVPPERHSVLQIKQNFNGLSNRFEIRFHHMLFCSVSKQILFWRIIIRNRMLVKRVEKTVSTIYITRVPSASFTTPKQCNNSHDRCTLWIKGIGCARTMTTSDKTRTSYYIASLPDVGIYPAVFVQTE